MVASVTVAKELGIHESCVIQRQQRCHHSVCVLATCRYLEVHATSMYHGPSTDNSVAILTAILDSRHYQLSAQLL